MGRLFIFLFVSFFLIAGNGAQGIAAEGRRAHPQIEMLDSGALKDFAEKGKVPQQVELLEHLIGTWDCNLTFWVNKGATPQMSSGYVVNEMIMDGRFLSSHMEAVLNLGGQIIPYKNLGYIGYDMTRGEFTSMWMDALHNGMIEGSGKFDMQKKLLEQKGAFTFPGLDKARKYRWTIEFDGSEDYKESVYLTSENGQEYKAVEMSFHRKM